jgi:hypothetical protein
MPKGHGLFDAHRAKATVLKIMQIRTANAAKGHAHLQLARAWFFYFLGVNPKIFWRMTNDCTHGVS